MSKAFSGLDLDFGDAVNLYGRQWGLEESDKAFWEQQEARNRELDEMIAMGWGDVDQARLPSDWRTRRGPDNLEHRRRIQAGVKRANEARKQFRDQGGVRVFGAPLQRSSLPRKRGHLYVTRNGIEGRKKQAVTGSNYAS